MSNTHTWVALDDAGAMRRFALWIPAILRKNERYRAYGRGRFARIILSAKARKFEVLVRGLVAALGAPTIRSGVWSLTVHTIWDKQRHVGPSVPGGDSDASLSAVKDALQSTGVIDDDVRILSDHTYNHYEKGARGVFVVLDRLPSTLAEQESRVGGDLPAELLAARAASADLELRVASAKTSKTRSVAKPRASGPKSPALARKPRVSRVPKKVRKS